MKTMAALVVTALLGCAAEPIKEPPVERCCPTYGDFTADGSCFGHGRHCCKEDPDHDPLCRDAFGEEEQ